MSTKIALKRSAMRRERLSRAMGVREAGGETLHEFDPTREG